MATKQIKTTVAASRILAFIKQNPDTTARVIADKLSLPAGTVAPTIKALKAAERVRETGVLRQIDPETGDFLAGRPAKTLRTTSKGSRAADRIIEKAKALAAEQTEAPAVEETVAYGAL